MRLMNKEMYMVMFKFETNEKIIQEKVLESMFKY